MDLGIAGRTALVLGAGGGLGGAIARALADEGVAIAAASLHLEGAEATAAACEAAGVRSTALAWDLEDLEVVDANVGAVEQQLDQVDILVNVTGGPPPTPVSGQSPELWESHFRSMVLSVVAITDRVLPGMRERQWGRVITSTSSGVITPIPNLGLSNSLRATLLGWNKTLSREVAGDGVTCNVIVPGRVATDRVRFLDERRAEREGREVEEVAAASAATIPVGRYGRPEEYGGVVAFLASRQAAFVNGSVVRVDGGMIPSV